MSIQLDPVGVRGMYQMLSGTMTTTGHSFTDTLNRGAEPSQDTQMTESTETDSFFHGFPQQLLNHEKRTDGGIDLVPLNNK